MTKTTGGSPASEAAEAARRPEHNRECDKIDAANHQLLSAWEGEGGG